ncbi:NAD(P)-dependent dehydrogenase, short-chain alcohol dehydrogenase family [Parasphingorhabdus marina DSM 22363]|uniref:NAD(P)-dependent dehydrogenase, short-chain alcohol dehydrogenase family n=1 Tax=Parasphingorhabdus marina DSM 22363 TaxID=1123272 RepID=A0A1N6CMV4_9SPHN|nr:SDR family NAD(P)-dependent oxidoreductase [Parasphingorhabdus marina]SIN59901.1 NAD(P)-dependent dehydrogenase, short-chain alcohol dehydrogenase family [Parasphingorhabdus marina DSM 22363]
MSTVEFNDRVAIVTGAGAGLGREHALELARRGVKVVVNDFGGARDGSGGSAGPAEDVVNEIKAEGGTAMPAACSVTDYEAVQKMVADAIAEWGHVDIVVNNAGVLRDKSFHKMELADFDFVMDVHLMGSVNCTKAVWDHMRERQYGRLVMTTSSTGLYGNFGQANYGAAKLALVGFMNTLHQEGAGKGIHTNCISPVAATRMTEDIMPEEALKALVPEAVTPAVVYLCSDGAPSKTILTAGAGGYAAAKILETEGIWLPEAERNAEAIAANIDQILDETGMQEYANGGGQGGKFFRRMQEVMKG